MNQAAKTIVPIAEDPQSYPAMFRSRVAYRPEAIAYTIPVGDDYRDITWAHVRDDVDILAAALIASGLRLEQRVAIACSTRYEWIVADLAIASAAGATTTIYPNTTADEVEFIIEDSNSVILFVENSSQLAKVYRDGSYHSQIHTIVLIDDDCDDDIDRDRVVTWDQMMERGRTYLDKNPTAIDSAIASITADHLSTLIYTSGTTGRPKGVELLHRAWTHEGYAIKKMDFVNHDDLCYLWLPLAHVFGRDLLAVQMAVGFQAVVDGRVDRIMHGLSVTHPTILVGVPRIFEKVRAAVVTMNPSKGLKGRISRWAFATGRSAREYQRDQRVLPLHLRVKMAIADRLVFSVLRNKLGGRMRFMISGSAKLAPEVQEWFARANITIFEGYGATETAAIAFVNHPDRIKTGTVGQAVPGLEVAIAEDGEILLKGPTIARGYHNLDQENAEAFRDGWFSTGDIGHLDDEGYLTITDRKKDLFKTSNGKYVAPQKVENAVMAACPYISQVVAIGNDRTYVTALVALDPDALAKWAQRRSKTGMSYAELTQHPDIQRSIDRFIRRANRGLERHEQIKRYQILDRELSQEDGTMTASLKVRRHHVHDLYADLIEQMYSDTSSSTLVSS